MPRKDDALLLDMLLACHKLKDFTDNLDKNEFESNILVQSAVIREFQVLGEAARMMSQDGKNLYEQIPWVIISGMRNKLIHEYFDIRLDVVWATIQQDIPPLISQLEAITSPDDAS